MAKPPGLDLESYLQRIGHRGPRSLDLATLQALHVAHLAAIPFENLDVRLGRRIALDLPALERKLVEGRRGGYCFEQNTLFAAALAALGFPVETLEARVRPPGTQTPLPRTHMVLAVRVAERDYLCDVGFGGDGPLWPVPLDGGPSRQPDGVLEVMHEGELLHVLRRHGPAGAADLYAFTRQPVLAIDYEVANHYTATHPESRFRKTFTVQRSLPGERHILRDGVYTLRRDGEERVREVPRDELGALLRDVFGLRVSDAEVRQAAKPCS
jgi:N-hydroxyarylamine O-acetyltransferase